jgi:glycerol kinase
MGSSTFKVCIVFYHFGTYRNRLMMTLVRFFKVPSHILPAIVSSSQVYGEIKWGPLQGISISGCLGDQQASLVGLKCFDRGDSKNTYGTGAFLLMNVGNEPVFSSSGLLSTVAFQFGREGDVSYALEGSISVAGAAVKWLRDNLGMIKKPSEIDDLGSKGI